MTNSNNVTDAGLVDSNNMTNSNNVTDANLIDPSLIDSNNVSDSNITDFNVVTDSNNTTDSDLIASNSTNSNKVTDSNLIDSNNVTNTNNLTSQDNFNDKAFFIQIKSVNNKTNFVPDKVTLTVGDKIVWLNDDNSEHRITVGSDSRSGYQLQNSLIAPHGTIEHQFQLSGTYYSVLDDLISRGSITILDKGNEASAVSIPLED
jgi:plastocyanin